MWSYRTYFCVAEVIQKSIWNWYFAVCTWLWGQDKMATIFQATFSNAFSCMKICNLFTFHCYLFPRVPLTINIPALVQIAGAWLTLQSALCLLMAWHCQVLGHQQAQWWAISGSMYMQDWQLVGLRATRWTDFCLDIVMVGWELEW